MFISSNKLVKQMKRAYKGGGLNLGYADGNLIINTNNISLAIDEENASNSIKAAFVEYLGYIPTEDCYYLVHKDVANPQSRLTETDGILDLLLGYRRAELKAFSTPLNYLGLRVFQSHEGFIFGIDEEYLQLINKSAIDYGNESEPTGPCYIIEPDGGLYWHNDFCTLIVKPTGISNEHLLEVLSGLKYHKKDNKQDAAETE